MQEERFIIKSTITPAEYPTVIVNHEIKKIFDEHNYTKLYISKNISTWKLASFNDMIYTIAGNIVYFKYMSSGFKGENTAKVFMVFEYDYMKNNNFPKEIKFRLIKTYDIDDSITEYKQIVGNNDVKCGSLELGWMDIDALDKLIHASYVLGVNKKDRKMIDTEPIEAASEYHCLLKNIPDEGFDDGIILIDENFNVYKDAEVTK